MNHKIIKQPYQLTSARYSISIHEQRVFVRIIEALQPDMVYKGGVVENILGDKMVVLPTKSLLPQGSTNYSVVKTALKKLHSRQITMKCYDDKRGEYEVYTGMILKSRYFKNNELVEIQICKDMLPHYICLAHGFTKYRLSTFFKITSPYTARIYQELSHWVNTHRLRILRFDDLKKTLNLGSKYPLSAQFKQSILLPAQKELKDKADVWFEILGEEKEGRKVVGWKTKIYKREEGALKPSESTQKNEPKKTQEETKNLSNETEKIDHKFLSESKEKYAERRLQNQLKNKKTLKPKKT